MNQFNTEKIKALHEEGLQVAAQHSKCEARLVEILCELHETKGYLLYRAESLRQYATTMWQLPENTISDLVTVARKACEIPEVINALQKRRATISKLRKVCPVLTAENHKEWLALVAECSTRIIEKAVAMAKPETALTEQFTYKAENLIELRVGVSEETFLKLGRLKDLLSQKKKQAVGLHEVLAYVAELVIEKEDPIRKAQRAATRKKAKAAESETTNSKQDNEAAHATSLSRLRRRKISVSIIHSVNLRDQAQCTHLNHLGQRCPNRRWLEVHHLQPLAEGGLDQLDNLTTLCSAHHRMHHVLETMPTHSPPN